MLEFLFIFSLSYLFGSIPFGLIISNIKNIDIRNIGSGNIGATNVARSLGIKYGILVWFLDGLKGVVPVFYFQHSPIAALGAVIGHMFPVWLNFKGGKGISTFSLSLFLIDYKLGIIFALTWVIVFIIFRISFVSALISTITVFGFSIVFIKDMDINLYVVISAMLIFYRHKSNIANFTKNKLHNLHTKT